MLEDIKNYLKEVPHALFVILVLIVAFGAFTVLQGCNLASLVQVAVPPQVKEAVGIPPEEKVTLDEADMVYTDWVAYVDSNTRKFESAIDDANERYAVIKQITDIGIGVATDNVGGVPGGAVLLSVLSLIGGILGILLGLGLGALGSYALNIGFLPDYRIVVASFIFSAVVGVVFGYFPARRAARLDPIEALRHQ